MRLNELIRGFIEPEEIILAKAAAAEAAKIAAANGEIDEDAE